MNSLQPSAFNLAPPPTLQWQPVRSADFLAICGRSYPVNTTSAAITVTLPASPSAGDQITLTDYAGTWDTNNLTINPNGNKVEGSTINQIVSVKRGSVNLVYIDSTQGWITYSNVATDIVVPNVVPVDVLLVAGGGGGGRNIGGGGGGGGFREKNLDFIKGSTYTISVGSPGAGGAYADATRGSNGGNSSVSGNGISADPGSAAANTVVAYGGGGGGSYDGINGGSTGLSGNNGGSGGGGGSGDTTAGPKGNGNTPTTSPSQGNDGGAGRTGTDPWTGGGGGGAGGTGGTGTTTAGAGGAASSSSYSGTATTYSAGGGGGAHATGSTGGSGVSGVSGAGAITGGATGGSGSSTAGSGATNRGGGGGGCGFATGSAGAGGSGVVIVRYPDTYSAATSTTGTPDVSTSGGYRIYKFTGNGSITL